MKFFPVKKNPFSGLGRNVVILGLVSFFTDASSDMIYPLLPLFVTLTLGASAEMLGLIEGVAESTASLLKLFSGWLSDKLQKRKALAVAGYALASLSRPFMAMALIPWHVLFVRFIDRIGKGIRTAPRDALIADSTNVEFRGKAFGFHRAMDHAGAIVGPIFAMGVLFLAPNNYRLVFWLAVIPAVVSVIILIVGAKEITPEPASQAPLLTFRGIDPNFRLYLGIVFLFALGNSSDAFLLLRAKDLGVSAVSIPIIWVVLHVVKALSSMPGGSLSDRIGRKKVIILGWIMYALVYAAFALSTSAWQAWGLFALYGVYFGLTEGVEKALVADLVKPEIRGLAYGVFNCAIGIGALPASIIMGVLWHRINPGVAFLFGASLALVASILLCGVKERKACTTA